MQLWKLSGKQRGGRDEIRPEAAGSAAAVSTSSTASGIVMK